MKDMGKFFKHKRFLTGLSDSLCDKVLEAKKDTFAKAWSSLKNWSPSS
jgi:hypothetical protein